MGKIKRPGVVVFASDDSGAPRYYIFKRSFSSPRHSAFNPRPTTNERKGRRTEEERNSRVGPILRRHSGNSVRDDRLDERFVLTFR